MQWRQRISPHQQVYETICKNLINSVPEWESETQSVNPKWLEHHQSGHLVKDPTCPVCMEEAGSKINHRRKHADRHPGDYAL